jgi:heme/copper-type cytochrome/quinol oxidase subunit 2
MLPIDPQFVYIILLLPSLFGLTLIGEGFHKIAEEEMSGIISIIFGIIFIIIVIAAYLFFSSFLKYHH